MTSKKTHLTPTDAQGALLQCAKGYDNAITWNMLVEKLADPEWNKHRFCWEGQVPDELCEVWPKLPIEACIVAYIFAKRNSESANDWADAWE